MKTSCIIDSYNYAGFVVEAVNSALNQSIKFDEIIIVDDGSKDESACVLKDNFTNIHNVQIILKENGGQLSAFNAGFLASSGDIVFFLDSDDIYHPNYLETALKTYQNHECDYLICEAEKLQDAATNFPIEDRNFEDFSATSIQVRDLGRSIISVLYGKLVIGGPTSALSVRRKILDKILPFPYAEDWRTRPDDYLSLAASIAGAKKFLMTPALVKWRIHTRNVHFYDLSNSNADYHYKREIAIERLITYFRTSLSLESDLTFLAPLEFKTIAKPTREDFTRYTKIVRNSSLKSGQKIRALLVICKHMVNSRKLLQST